MLLVDAKLNRRFPGREYAVRDLDTLAARRAETPDKTRMDFGVSAGIRV